MFNLIKKKQTKKVGKIQRGLQVLMSKHDLSREDIASRLGVSTMTIYRWERGKTFPQSRLMLKEFEKLRQGLEKREEK